MRVRALSLSLIALIVAGVSMYEAGLNKLGELVTQNYKLDDINEAMKDLRAVKTSAA